MQKLELASDKNFRHQLIQSEFRSALSLSALDVRELIVPDTTDAVVVLSAAPSKNEAGEVITEASAENVARIDAGVEIALNLTATTLNKKVSELSETDLIQAAPVLILNGETEQLPMMELLTKEWGFPAQKIILLTSGDRGASNTKTQFEALQQDPTFKKIKEAVFITSDYHVPRVSRTAQAHLAPETKYVVLPVGHLVTAYPVYSTIRAEVKRILAYAAKGDIVKVLSQV